MRTILGLYFLIYWAQTKDHNIYPSRKYNELIMNETAQYHMHKFYRNCSRNHRLSNISERIIVSKHRMFFTNIKKENIGHKPGNYIWDTHLAYLARCWVNKCAKLFKYNKEPYKLYFKDHIQAMAHTYNPIYSGIYNIGVLTEKMLEKALDEHKNLLKYNLIGCGLAIVQGSENVLARLVCNYGNKIGASSNELHITNRSEIKSEMSKIKRKRSSETTVAIIEGKQEAHLELTPGSEEVAVVNHIVPNSTEEEDEEHTVDLQFGVWLHGVCRCNAHERDSKKSNKLANRLKPELLYRIGDAINKANTQESELTPKPTTSTMDGDICLCTCSVDRVYSNVSLFLSLVILRIFL